MPVVARFARGALLAATALMIAVGPAAAAGAHEATVPKPVAAIGAHGDVDDFTFDSFTADYTLGKDPGSGRSTLATIEQLVAVFPDFDQNRGIVRAIPTNFNDHNTHIDVKSVTDGDGKPRSFDMGTDGDFTTITIAVPKGQYVHGTQTYVITYTQVDVTRFYPDSNDDEFYWDTNGTGWDQPFGTISANVHLASGLSDALNGHTACYFGYEGATDPCQLQRAEDGFSAEVSDATQYQNMTVAIGFAKGTFADAPFDLLHWVPLSALLGIVALLLSIIGSIVLRVTALRDHPGKGIVVAQYEPQKNVSAWLASNIVGQPKKGMPATIVDLAVRRKLKILERADTRGHKTYGVQEIDDSGLESDAQQTMFVLFSTGFFLSPSQPERWFVSRDIILGQQVQSLQATVQSEAMSLGLRRKGSGWPTAVMVLLAILSFVFFLFGAIFSNDANGTGIVFGVLGANIVPWITIFLISRVAGRTPLTDAGADVRDYLKGLELYIRMAEADRLKMLQSVTGAERVSGAGGAGTVVQVYERLLPYAIIFGLEKEWSETLQQYYNTNPPDWYAGDSLTGFRVGAFAASISSFSSSVSSASSYSSSGGSSSGGGSSGGGSSGGGGGGGGGGGI